MGGTKEGQAARLFRIPREVCPCGQPDRTCKCKDFAAEIEGLKRAKACLLELLQIVARSYRIAQETNHWREPGGMARSLEARSSRRDDARSSRRRESCISKHDS